MTCANAPTRRWACGEANRLPLALDALRGQLRRVSRRSCSSRSGRFGGLLHGGGPSSSVPKTFMLAASRRATKWMHRRPPGALPPPCGSYPSALLHSQVNACASQRVHLDGGVHLFVMLHGLREQVCVAGPRRQRTAVGLHRSSCAAAAASSATPFRFARNLVLPPLCVVLAAAQATRPSLHPRLRTRRGASYAWTIRVTPSAGEPRRQLRTRSQNSEKRAPGGISPADNPQEWGHEDESKVQRARARKLAEARHTSHRRP